MEELGLIRDLSIVWLTALIAGAICARVRLPMMVGYIASGVVIGPFGFRLVQDVDNIRVLSEMGVALLLFALGVELSLRHIFASATRTVVAGFVQIGITVIVAGAFARYSGLTPEWTSALIFGFITALSSTALVTKLIVDRGEAETSHARLLISMLLLQDLSLIPVVALLPALQGQGDSTVALLTALAKSALLVVLVFVGATWVVPKFLSEIVKANSRELFLLSIISLCLGVALLSHQLGVSLALGAFLAGIMVSERPYGQQVITVISPLRDLFATLFFVSVGLLLNPGYVSSNPMQVIQFVLLILIGKAMIGWIAASFATRARWTAALTGIGIAQVGEFSFVLATIARTNGLLSESAYNLFLAGAVLSLLLSPAMMALAPRMLIHFLRMQDVTHPKTPADKTHRFNNHLILCGFGRIGRNVGMSLASYGVPLVVVESNPEAVEEITKAGIPHVYGDAFSPSVLERAGAKRAACVVIAIPDPVVAVATIDYVRHENPQARIIARAHHLEDVDQLKKAGACAIVQPEFEASLELLKVAMVGMNRDMVQVESALKDLRRYSHLVYHPELTTPETI